MRLLALGLAAVCMAFVALGAESAVEIPFERFKLENGLTVLVHEDHKAPIVAVNVWYHVGSKNERTGKTGFAHLFEHLMFNGSEHYNDDYFKVLEKLGATDMNGTTNNDRTNYFQNVPTPALDTVLWMESDRMGHLLGAIDQKRLDEQRGVVQNEKRQGENQPYGIDEEVIAANTYPAGHPYSWDVIGSMDDLNAASLKDVQEWFKTYYGPSNAVLVLAGDIDVKTAKEKATQYFGALPPGPPLTVQRSWVARMTGSHRSAIDERVPQPRLYKIWNTAEYLSKDDLLLDLAAYVLGGDKTSRLYKRLIYQDQLATQVAAFQSSKEIGSQFEIQVTGKPGANLDQIERIVNEEMARFLAEGPTTQELEQAKTQFIAGFVRGNERIGGFGGKSDTLAQYEVYTGDAGNYRKTLEIKQSATVGDIKRIANGWLTSGEYTLLVHPFTEWKAAPKDADRSKFPDPGKAPALTMPPLQRLTLGNGLKVILVERHQTPLVEFGLVQDSGYAADQTAVPGTATLAMTMLTEGAAGKSAPQISDEVALLGANLSAGCSADNCLVRLSALKSNLVRSLQLMMDVALRPDFPQQEFVRVQKLRLAGIQREKADPFTTGLRVLSAVTYGSAHPYGTWSGTGTEASVQKITRDMLVNFHRTWFKPNHATLVVTGDATLAELKPLLEKMTEGWKPGEIPAKRIEKPTQPERPVIYFVDKPGAEQSVLLTGNFAPPRNARDEAAVEVMNAALGGQFVSRLNMNLREDKHWSYGAGSFVRGVKGERQFISYAPVQTDKTAESLTEMKKELSAYVHDKPVTEEELAMAKSNLAAALPGSLETLQSLNGIVREMVEYQLPDDYFPAYATRIEALDRGQITAAAERNLRPGGLAWVVVGDRSKVEAGVRKLSFGDVKLVDADGNVVDGAQAQR